MLACSVARLDNLLRFGRLFKACGNNFSPNWSHFLKDAGIFHSFSEGTFWQLYFGHWATFYSSQLVILQ